jgi:PAS domain-containing protein
VRLENVVGHTADEFFDADTATLLHEHDAKVLASGQSTQQRETRFFKKSGARHRYLTIKTPIVGPQGEIVGLSGVSIDITESEHFEQALKENQQFLDAILDSVDGYIYTKSQDHRYTYTNRAAAALFQRTPEELLGMQDSELLPPKSSSTCGHPTSWCLPAARSRPPRCSCRPPTGGCATSG